MQDNAASLNVFFQKVDAAITQNMVANAAPTLAAVTFGETGLPVPFAIGCSFVG